MYFKYHCCYTYKLVNLYYFLLHMYLRVVFNNINLYKTNFFLFTLCTNFIYFYTIILCKYVYVEKMIYGKGIGSGNCSSRSPHETWYLWQNIFIFTLLTQTGQMGSCNISLWANLRCGILDGNHGFYSALPNDSCLIKFLIKYMFS